MLQNVSCDRMNIVLIRVQNVANATQTIISQVVSQVSSIIKLTT